MGCDGVLGCDLDRDSYRDEVGGFGWDSIAQK